MQVISNRKRYGYLGLAAGALVALGLTLGCDVEQTEEGEMPDVEVESGELPEYDVDAADVDVGTKTKTVEVPNVEIVMEEKTVEVPFIDVEWPDETVERVQQQVTVRLEVPNESFDVSIEEIHVVDDELWVISRLTGDAAGESASAVVSDTVVVNAPEMDIRHYIIGSNAEPVADDVEYELVSSRSEIADELGEGRHIYTASS